MQDRPPIIAVVEDDTSMLRSIQRLLTMEGFAVEAYASAEGFLDRKSEGRIECLVLDIQLPRMSGIELQQRLVATHCDISIIFMTALDDEAVRHQALEAGCVTFLHKPFPAHQLIEAIKRAVPH